MSRNSSASELRQYLNDGPLSSTATNITKLPTTDQYVPMASDNDSATETTCSEYIVESIKNPEEHFHSARETFHLPQNSVEENIPTNNYPYKFPAENRNDSYSYVRAPIDPDEQNTATNSSEYSTSNVSSENVNSGQWSRSGYDPGHRNQNVRNRKEGLQPQIFPTLPTQIPDSQVVDYLLDIQMRVLNEAIREQMYDTDSVETSLRQTDLFRDVEIPSFEPLVVSADDFERMQMRTRPAGMRPGRGHPNMRPQNIRRDTPANQFYTPRMRQLNIEIPQNNYQYQQGTRMPRQVPTSQSYSNVSYFNSSQPEINRVRL